MSGRNVAALAGLQLAGCLFALPAVAGEMTSEQARRFVVGKTFAFSCFDGTTGAGRVFADGSVAGTVQAPGATAKFLSLPSNTVRANGEKICASVRGVPFEPCFNLVQTTQRSFRGAIAGFGFAYCDFVRGGGGGNGRKALMRTANRGEAGKPLALRSSIAQ